jgi:hypothetical protein
MVWTAKALAFEPNQGLLAFLHKPSTGPAVVLQRPIMFLMFGQDQKIRRAFQAWTSTPSPRTLRAEPSRRAGLAAASAHVPATEPLHNGNLPAQVGPRQFTSLACDRQSPYRRLANPGRGAPPPCSPAEWHSAKRPQIKNSGSQQPGANASRKAAKAPAILRELLAPGSAAQNWAYRKWLSYAALVPFSWPPPTLCRWSE